MTLVKGYAPGRPVVLLGQSPVGPSCSLQARLKRTARIQAIGTWVASQAGAFFADTAKAFTDPTGSLPLTTWTRARPSTTSRGQRLPGDG